MTPNEKAFNNILEVHHRQITFLRARVELLEKSLPRKRKKWWHSV